jgi:hypothetical protein
MAAGGTDEPTLEQLAARYVWWLSSRDALSRTTVFLCQIMRLGTFEDAQAVRRMYGDDALRAALAEAPAGALDPRSWTYWHHVLGRLPVPRMPERPLP